MRINIKEIGINTSNWVDSAQDRDYLGATDPPDFKRHVVS